MNRFDIQKVISAGFRVFRLATRAADNHCIHEATGNGGWKKFDSYPSHASAKRAFTALMEDPKNLEG